MTTKTTKTTKSTIVYDPSELKTLIDALNAAPAYLSKRFILMHLCGWSKDMIDENVKMFKEEQDQIKQGDKAWR